MHSTIRSRSSLFLLLLVVLVALAAFAGCKGSDGAQGPAGQAGATGATGPTGSAGPQGPHGSFANSTSCIDCHHMSAMALSMGIPLRPRENGGANLVAGVTGDNVASFISATAGTPVTLSVVPFFTWIEASTGATHTVNVTGAYWQFMDGLPSTLTGAATSPTVTVTINTPADYRAELVNLATQPGTVWDTKRYRVVPINNFNKTLAMETRYMLTVFGDDGKVYWDLIGVRASNNDLGKYAPVHTTGEPVVPINLPVLITANSSSIASPMSWSLAKPAGSAAALSSTSDTYPYFTPDSAGTYTVTDNNTGAAVAVFAGTWRGILVGAPTGSALLPANYDTTCNGCHSVTDSPLTAWSGDTTAAPDKFKPWSNTGHAKRLTQGLNMSGPGEIYNSTCLECHTVGWVKNGSGNGKNNGGIQDQSGYDAFVANVINTATTPSALRYANAWSDPTYSTVLQRTNIQCEQCHGPQNNTGAHGAVAGMAGTRESLDANMCGMCHGAATHHTRYEQWDMSATGHSNFDLARNEGTNPSCAACHSAQGNLLYQRQLVNGNPLRTLPSASITWTQSTVQPQTCAVCHDPHNVGQESDDAYFTPEQVNNSAQPRFALLMAAKGLNPGDTPMLPGGFLATGIGKGNQCIICHNSRNGAGSGSNASNVYLHEDNSPVFGALTSYSVPHTAAQGDVFMGHNAYFMGDSGGTSNNYKSPHTAIPDTCVTCHMEKTPPPYLWTENDHGTNHTFKADVSICTECHTGLDTSLGPKLQADTSAMLGQVLTAIQNAVISQATGTYAGNIATAVYNPAFPSNTVTLRYNDLTPSNAVSLSTLVPVNTTAGQILAKAIWNYNLIANDKSMGIHNPPFIRNVLGNTYAQVMTLQ